MQHIRHKTGLQPTRFPPSLPAPSLGRDSISLPHGYSTRLTRHVWGTPCGAQAHLERNENPRHRTPHLQVRAPKETRAAAPGQQSGAERHHLEESGDKAFGNDRTRGVPAPGTKALWTFPAPPSPPPQALAGKAGSGSPPRGPQSAGREALHSTRDASPLLIPICTRQNKTGVISRPVLGQGEGTRTLLGRVCALGIPGWFCA